MENTITTDEAIKIINYASNLIVHPRGKIKKDDTNRYTLILEKFNLIEPFSKEDLIQKIIQYKENEFKLKMEILEDKLREL